MKETINSIFFHSVEKFFDRKSFSYYKSEKSITYFDLGRSVTQISGWLISQGIKPGDKVALLGESSPYWPQVYFAVTTMGAVLVPILPDFKSEGIAKILSHSEAKLLFASEKQRAKLEHIDLGLPTFPLEELPHSEISAETRKALDDAREAVEEEDLAAILYTSGTTGNSKGVMLSHKNFASNAEASSHIPSLKPGHDWLSLLPLAHTYECTMGMMISVISGSHTHYLDKPPAPSVLLKALKDIRPRIILSVPLLIEKIYNASIKPALNTGVLGFLYKAPFMRPTLHWLAGKKLYKTFGGRLLFFGVGGAPLSPDVERFLRDARFPYSIGYGLTETSPLLAGSPPLKGAFRSTGKILRRIQLRIGEGQEIQAKGPNVMLGYYKNEEQTKEVFTDDGWFKTGDIGEFDRKGNLFIKGRIKNVILGANGENIYPESIESVINSEPFVEESLVLEGGQGLTALVYFNYEKVVEEIKRMKYHMDHKSESHDFTPKDEDDKKGWIPSAEDVKAFTDKYTKSLSATVNKQLSSFSRISTVKEEKEPFIRTPTRKIKRFLYDHMGLKKDESDDKKSS